MRNYNVIKLLSVDCMIQTTSSILHKSTLTSVSKVKSVSRVSDFIDVQDTGYDLYHITGCCCDLNP